MTEDKRTLNDLLRERHAQGAAVVGGRLIPDGDRLVYVRHEQPAQPTATDGRQVRPETPSIFDRPAPDSIEGD